MVRIIRGVKLVITQSRFSNNGARNDIIAFDASARMYLGEAIILLEWLGGGSPVLEWLGLSPGWNGWAVGPQERTRLENVRK